MTRETELPVAVAEALARVSTATLAMQLVKRGMRHAAMTGVSPLDSRLFDEAGSRLVGRAYTFSFLPFREDLATPESMSGPNSIRAALDAFPAGAVAVLDARGVTRCGVMGDILVTRLKARGAAGVVTDGAIRDAEAVVEVGLPVFAAATSAAPAIAGLSFAGTGAAIGCAGVTVVPGDVIVGDREAVVVIPDGLAEEIAEAAVEQERFELYVQERVRAGDALEGLYPPNEAAREAYAAWARRDRD